MTRAGRRCPNVGCNDDLEITLDLFHECRELGSGDNPSEVLVWRYGHLGLEGYMILVDVSDCQVRE